MPIKYKVYTTEEFDRDYKKLDKSIKKQIDKEIEQIEINPYVGKPLGYKFFREKRARNYRFYYLIYDEYVVVFVIALSTKKDQQFAINTIKAMIPEYRKEIEKRLKQKSS